MSSNCNVFFVDIDLTAAVSTAVRFYHFTPQTIDELFLDDIDYHGLYFWYEDAKKYIEQIEKNNK